MTLKVLINPLNIELTAEKGDILLTVMREGGVRIESLCGGLHTYKKVQRKLVQLELSFPGMAGDALAKEEEVVGELTTVSGRRALGYLDEDLLEPGTQLDGAVVCDGFSS